MDTYYYCTTFCNQGHSVRTGKPLNHECYVLPPEAIAFEEVGSYERAIETIEAAKPLRTHTGTRCRHRWRAQKLWDRQGNVIHLGEHCKRCGLEKT